jgi:hypothetical protein
VHASVLVVDEYACVRVRVRQARYFGRSPYLEALDYQSPAQLPFATGHVVQGKWSKLTMALTANAVKYLSVSGGNQFRVTMVPNYFTNRNGKEVRDGCLCEAALLEGR